MKLKCNISGIDWSDNNLFKHSRKSYYQNHPIFSLSFNELESIYEQQFCRTLLNATETRLLALALFNKTNLIIWDCSAKTDYPLKTALKAIPMLISTNKMLNDNSYNRESLIKLFAQCRISELNNNMAIMLAMVDEWRINYYEAFQIDWRVKHTLAVRDSALESLNRIIRTSYREPHKYIKHLSEYIISCLSGKALAETLVFPNGKLLRRDFYKYIIQYSGNVETGSYIYPITSADINSLIDLMIEQLDYENIFCFTAMELLNNMLKTGAYNRYGLSMLDIDDNEDEKEKVIAAWVIDNPEPVRTDYPDYMAFFLARNQWIVSKNNCMNEAKGE